MGVAGDGDGVTTTAAIFLRFLSGVSGVGLVELMFSPLTDDKDENNDAGFLILVTIAGIPLLLVGILCEVGTTGIPC